jgi:hypothetical protein
MEITIKSIPLKQLVERYGVESAGDYWRPTENNIQIRVVKMDNPDMEFLVAIHEMVEEWLCNKRGIKETDIQKFDQNFDELGKEGEPGDDKNAPYRKEHFFATTIERLICAELGVDWNEYDAAIEKLFEV